MKYKLDFKKLKNKDHTVSKTKPIIRKKPKQIIRKKWVNR